MWLLYLRLTWYLAIRQRHFQINNTHFIVYNFSLKIFKIQRLTSILKVHFTLFHNWFFILPIATFTPTETQFTNSQLIIFVVNMYSVIVNELWDLLQICDKENVQSSWRIESTQSDCSWKLRANYYFTVIGYHYCYRYYYCNRMKIIICHVYCYCYLYHYC